VILGSWVLTKFDVNDVVEVDRVVGLDVVVDTVLILQGLDVVYFFEIWFSI